jgi:hypothetical protein
VCGAEGQRQPREMMLERHCRTIMQPGGFDKRRVDENAHSWTGIPVFNLFCQESNS